MFVGFFGNLAGGIKQDNMYNKKFNFITKMKKSTSKHIPLFEQLYLPFVISKLMYA